jgi:hypothetical protein
MKSWDYYWPIRSFRINKLVSYLNGELETIVCSQQSFQVSEKKGVTGRAKHSEACGVDASRVFSVLSTTIFVVEAYDSRFIAAHCNQAKCLKGLIGHEATHQNPRYLHDYPDEDTRLEEVSRCPCRGEL